MLHKPIVIFVRPKAHGNVGALARVMSNFEIDELRLVQNVRGEDSVTRHQKDPIDWALACRGKSIIENASHFETLEAALEDVFFSVGTTARPREGDNGYTRSVYSFDKLLELKNESFSQKWALVLGPEDDGLNEAELALCNSYVMIPTSEKSPSMNVAMAAGCLLYHWSFASKSIAPSLSQKTNELASLGEINKLSRYILECLKLSDFFKYPDEEAVLARIRRLYQGEEISRGDLLFAFEIFYQLKSRIMGSHEDRNFLK